MALHHLDTFWSNQDIMFDYTADIQNCENEKTNV